MQERPMFLKQQYQQYQQQIKPKIKQLHLKLKQGQLKVGIHLQCTANVQNSQAKHL